MKSRLTCSSLTAMAALLIPLLAGCRSTFWSPDSKSIALDVGGTLRLFNVATKQFRTLDTGGRYAVNPAYSPDGKALAYYGITTKGGKPEGVELWVRDFTANKERRILAGMIAPEAMKESTGGGNSAPQIAFLIKFLLPISWSPDSRRVSSVRVSNDGGDGLLIDVASGKATPLPNPTHAQAQVFTNWSPDGKRLAYFALLKPANPAPGGPTDTPAELWVADSDGNNPKRIWKDTAQQSIWPFAGPTWSADGSSLLFLTAKKQGNMPAPLGPEIFKSLFGLDAQVIPASGGTAKALLHGMTPFGMISSDLKAVAYLGGEKVDSLLYKTAPFTEGKTLDRVTPPANPQNPQPPPNLAEGVIPFPTLSPDGKTIAMAMDDLATHKAELRLYDVATGKKTVAPIQ